MQASSGRGSARADKRRSSRIHSLANYGWQGRRQMRFTVVYSPAASDGLALAWLAASDRNSVTNAAHAIDRTLRLRPGKVGRNMGENHRLWTHGPLTVIYTFRLEDALVEILDVSM